MKKKKKKNDLGMLWWTCCKCASDLACSRGGDPGDVQHGDHDGPLSLLLLLLLLLLIIILPLPLLLLLRSGLLHHPRGGDALLQHHCAAAGGGRVSPPGGRRRLPGEAAVQPQPAAGQHPPVGRRGRRRVETRRCCGPRQVDPAAGHGLKLDPSAAGARRHPEVVLARRLQVEGVELRDGAAPDLHPVGALPAEPGLHLVGDDLVVVVVVGGGGGVRPPPAEGDPVAADLLHRHRAVCGADEEKEGN